MCNNQGSGPKTKFPQLQAAETAAQIAAATATATASFPKTQKKFSKLHNEIDARNVQYPSTWGRCNRCKGKKREAATCQTLEAESSRLSSTWEDFRVPGDPQTNKSNLQLSSFARLGYTGLQEAMYMWPKSMPKDTTQPPCVVTKFGYEFTAAQPTRKNSLSNAACHFYLQIFMVLRFWL